MFNLRITTNTERRPASTKSLSMTVAQVIDQEDVRINNATVTLNGAILGASDFGRTFAELGCMPDKESILSVVVKADSAA